MAAQPRVFLSDFKFVIPPFVTDQRHGIEWLAAAHAMAERTARNNDPSFNVDAFCDQMRKFITRFGCGPERIARRFHALPDFTHFDWEAMRIFNVTKDARGAAMDARGAFFEETVGGVFDEVYEEAAAPPDDLVHVTCTGYVSPSGAQGLVEKKGWSATTTVTHAYHMGCYASVPALRLASGFLSSRVARRGDLASAQGRVDVVHTELCTLHLNPSQHDPEQLVVQSLFADGHVKYSLSNEAPANGGFEVLSLREEIVPRSAHAMSWRCSEWGMRMTLAREVPALIADALGGFLERLLAQAGLEFAAHKEACVFAVHPGGPKIIDRVQELLSLRPDQVRASQAVLFERGNMSSATLPHVWGRIASDGQVAPGTLVVSLAFGPGLTMCGAVLRKA